jgi:PAS domain S-box-containing protein
VSDQNDAARQNAAIEVSVLREKLGDTIRVLTHLKAGGMGSQASDELASLLTSLQTDLESLERVLEAQAEERAGLAALADVAGIVNSSLKLPEVLNQVMDQIIRLMGAERAFLMLYDEETRELEFQAARNLDQETVSESSFEISRSVVYQVASDGEPVLATNAQLDPRFKGQESVVSYALRSILCVPLRVRERIIGVVYADNRIRTGIFTEQDRDMLTAFADQAAIAIENARLFENVTAAKTLMDNVFASIASGVITTDVEGFITLLNRAAGRILGVIEGQAEGRHHHEALPAFAPVLDSLMEEVQRDKQPIVGREIEPELPERGRVNLQLSIAPLQEASEEWQGLAVVMDDLTERRRLEAQERFIRETFQRYVSPAVVQRLLEDPGSLRLGGNRQEVTIFFADIRGFTTFSEERAPEELVEVLNGYLALGAEAVLAEEGTLDKFIGDAVMAIYNAPLSQPDHTIRAVRTAVRMRDAIIEHHKNVAPADRLNYGAGIAVGEAVVGNVGTAQQLNYTAIGASVNLAKRLQETAAAGQILLSEWVYKRVEDIVEGRELDPVTMKGFSVPIKVYELLELR